MSAPTKDSSDSRPASATNGESPEEPAPSAESEVGTGHAVTQTHDQVPSPQPQRQEHAAVERGTCTSLEDSCRVSNRVRSDESMKEALRDLGEDVPETVTEKKTVPVAESEPGAQDVPPVSAQAQSPSTDVASQGPAANTDVSLVPPPPPPTAPLEIKMKSASNAQESEREDHSLVENLSHLIKSEHGPREKSALAIEPCEENSMEQKKKETQIEKGEHPAPAKITGSRGVPRLKGAKGKTSNRKCEKRKKRMGLPPPCPPAAENSPTPSPQVKEPLHSGSETSEADLDGKTLTRKKGSRSELRRRAAEELEKKQEAVRYAVWSGPADELAPLADSTSDDRIVLQLAQPKSPRSGPDASCIHAWIAAAFDPSREPILEQNQSPKSNINVNRPDLVIGEKPVSQSPTRIHEGRGEVSASSGGGEKDDKATSDKTRTDKNSKPEQGQDNVSRGFDSNDRNS